MADVKPNNTIYINNLNEKVKKDELKKALYAIFSQFGSIVEIYAFKTLKMRGQAHVVFKDLNSAATALRSMQGFPFYDKPMRIQFSREDSDVISKAKGTFVDRPKKNIAAPKKKKKIESVPLPDSSSSTATAAGKKGKSAGVKSEPKANAPPNAILFVTNLPDDTTKDKILAVFNQFLGLKDIRLVPGRTDIAFVEYDREEAATSAKKALNQFRISPSHAIRVEYANK